MSKARKVIQIALGGEGNAQLYCLCDDGTVWAWNPLKNQWAQIPVDVPQPT